MVYLQESAASQALRIPHILAAVLFWLRDDWRERIDDSLLTFRFVNTLWAEEANKVLWEECRPNDIRFPRLAYLPEIEMDRRQKYATYIRKLCINDYYWYDNGVGYFSFPRLEELIMSLPMKDGFSYQLLFLNQFVQSRLKRLEILVSHHNFCAISPDFFQELQLKSPGLREISIIEDEKRPPDDRWKPSPAQVTSFLQSFKSLEIISWKLKGTMSKASFRALSLCPQLKMVAIWPIHDSWMEDGLPVTAFPLLNTLRCIISGRALQTLVPFVESITYLELTQVDQSTDLWQAFIKTQFRRLKSLTLRLHPETILHANELLLIGQCYPWLGRLQIVSADKSRNSQWLHIQDFSDETVTELAKLLPKLMSITLRCYNPEADKEFVLSEISIIALGFYCPLLQDCNLFAKVDWEKLAEDASFETWPNLQSIHIHRGRSDDDALFEYHDMKELVRLLAQLMPALGRCGWNSVSFGGARRLRHAVMSYMRDWQSL